MLFLWAANEAARAGFAKVLSRFEAVCRTWVCIECGVGSSHQGLSRISPASRRCRRRASEGARAACLWFMAAARRGASAAVGTDEQAEKKKTRKNKKQQCARQSWGQIAVPRRFMPWVDETQCQRSAAIVPFRQRAPLGCPV